MPVYKLYICLSYTCMCVHMWVRGGTQVCVYLFICLYTCVCISLFSLLLSGLRGLLIKTVYLVWFIISRPCKHTSVLVLLISYSEIEDPSICQKSSVWFECEIQGLNYCWASSVFETSPALLCWEDVLLSDQLQSKYFLRDFIAQRHFSAASQKTQRIELAQFNKS